jgi:hypothetical protein
LDRFGVKGGRKWKKGRNRREGNKFGMKRGEGEKFGKRGEKLIGWQKWGKRGA